MWFVLYMVVKLVVVVLEMLLFWLNVILDMVVLMFLFLIFGWKFCVEMIFFVICCKMLFGVLLGRLFVVCVLGGSVKYVFLLFVVVIIIWLLVFVLIVCDVLMRWNLVVFLICEGNFVRIGFLGWVVGILNIGEIMCRIDLFFFWIVVIFFGVSWVLLVFFIGEVIGVCMVFWFCVFWLMFISLFIFWIMICLLLIFVWILFLVMCLVLRYLEGLLMEIFFVGMVCSCMKYLFFILISLCFFIKWLVNCFWFLYVFR